jgi:poly(3-hydroxybutyrate) depolymerase
MALLCMFAASSAVASTHAKPVVTKKPSTVPKKRAATAARTLDAIRIEGEIDVPQVLFITARDYRRFRDGTPAPYQTTSADIAKSIPLPKRVRVVAPVE